MADLTRTYDPAEGPILNVIVCAPGQENGLEIPLLMDSGADASSISTEAAAALNLPPMGKRQTFASGGDQGETHTFLVDILISFDDGSVGAFRDVVVSEFKYQKPSIRGLIGRDILCKGEFTLRSDQHFTFELAQG